MIKSIVKFSQLEGRLDAEYYNPEYLDIVNKLLEIGSKRISLFTTLNCRGIQPKYNTQSKYRVLTSQYIKKDGIVYESLPSITDDHFSKGEKSRIKINDIVIYTTGANVGHVGIWKNNTIDAIASNHVNILRVKGVNPNFLYIFLSSCYGQMQFQRATSGAAQAELYPSDIGYVLFPLAKEKIQNKIGKLVQSSYVKGYIAERKYQEAQELINEYLGIDKRPVEYKKAFSISFSQLEDRFDGEYYQLMSLLNNRIFKDGFVKLGKIAMIQMGKTPSKQSYINSGIRILKVRDLTNKGIDWEEGNRAFVKTENWNGSERGKTQEGDILLISAAHQAYYIGKKIDIVFDIPAKYEKKLMAVAELLTIRSNEPINPYILLWYLRTPVAYKQIQQQITGETSHLYPRDLVNLEIPKSLLKFKEAKKIETLTKESILLKKESKQLLEKAKSEVERLIEKGGGDDSQSSK